MRRGDDAHARAAQAGVAHASVLARLGLQKPQQHGLHGFGHLPDFIEEERAARGRLDEPRVVGGGAREGPAHMAEELAAEALGRELGAVERDEGPLRAGPVVVEPLGEHVLADTRRPEEEHGQSGGRRASALLERTGTTRRDGGEVPAGLRATRGHGGVVRVDHEPHPREVVAADGARRVARAHREEPRIARDGPRVAVVAAERHREPAPLEVVAQHRRELLGGEGVEVGGDVPAGVVALQGQLGAKPQRRLQGPGAACVDALEGAVAAPVVDHRHVPVADRQRGVVLRQRRRGGAHLEALPVARDRHRVGFAPAPHDDVAVVGEGVTQGPKRILEQEDQRHHGRWVLPRPESPNQGG